MKQRDPQLKIRLKPETKSWIEEKAEQEDRSQTWLINHYLQEAMRRETKNSAA
nr:hypothetical protein [uncultured Halomonas sp.]|tara:strand:+ start:313 stop:471 length:159 start_codon:yes stop_codon:yes gene_type:complete